MSEDRTPKIFVSYSWSSDSLVVPLAERLMSHGVDVVLDKWDLKEGQDKYVFMEQCVNNPDITKVLIICDKAYADKANSRTGGVGDETAIISSEIYGNVNQEKFIPIIAERDEDGQPYVPTYIKTRIYIDLSDAERYEEEYEKLLRNIYEKPLHRKPKLGTRPEWLDEEKTNLFPLNDLIRQIKGSSNAKKQESCIIRFVDEYITTLKTFLPQSTDGQTIYDLFVDMKSVRDVFLDFLPVLDEASDSSSEIIGDAFEKMYNTLTTAQGFNPNARQADDRTYDIYRIHIWELFICVIAYFRHVQNYATINDLLTRTYFLTTSCFNETVAPANYFSFCHHSSILEEEYKPKTENKAKFTLLGNALCKEREKLPIFSGEAIAEADLFLYQIGNALPLVQDERQWRPSYWFPTCYVYAQKSPGEWIKMKSRKYCQRLYALFGVANLEELKNAVKNCTFDRDMHYRRRFDAAPAILSVIKLEDIGSLN